MPTNKSNGPDPEVEGAIQRLHRTELSPLEEQLFQAWTTANQLEEGGDDTYDYRKLYKESGGQIQPMGELKNKVEKESAIQAIMKAQEAHDQASPIKAMMDFKKGSQPTPGVAASSPGGMPDGTY